MERCRRCVLPLGLVKHDHQQVCIHCQTYHPEEESGVEDKKKKFDEMIRSFHGRGNKYDFFVTVTGGKDSTFVLHYMTKVLGINRILGFTWDHLFHREASWENMKNAIERTGVDFIPYQIIDAETTRAVHRGLFRKFGYTCTICFLLQSAVILNQAVRHRVPFIISGRTPGQAYLRGTNVLGPISPRQEVQDRLGIFTYVLRNSLADEIGKKLTEGVLEEILGEVRQAAKQDDFPWPHYVDMGAYLNWYREDENSLLKTLSDTLGFRKPSDTLTHTSCQLERVRGYQEFNFPKVDKTGYSAELSHFVRGGILSRQEALIELEKLGMTENLPEEAHTYVREVGLTIDEFNQRVRQPLPFFIKAYFLRVAMTRKVRNLFKRKSSKQE
jgi:hypothetical protein